MNYKIRECLLSDADQIYELNRNEMGYDYPREETRRKIKELLSSISHFK